MLNGFVNKILYLDLILIFSIIVLDLRKFELYLILSQMRITVRQPHSKPVLLIKNSLMNQMW